MSRMKGYTPRKFIELLIENGWIENRKKGSHLTFTKQNTNYIVTIPDTGSSKSKELPRPMIARIIKEAKIVEKFS